MQSDMVVVGVGAKPTGDMFKGQLDFLEERPGGIKVRGKISQFRGCFARRQPNALKRIVVFQDL